jgi:hypothetical protein
MSTRKVYQTASDEDCTSQTGVVGSDRILYSIVKLAARGSFVDLLLLQQ